MSTFGALANSLPLYTSAAPQIKYALVKGVLKGEDVTLVQPVIPWPKEASSAPEPTAIPSERPDTDGRLSGEHSSSQGAFGAFCVFDGHNGPQAAQSCKRDFLRLLLGQLPPGPMPQDPELPEFAGWRESIQKALAVTFHQMQHSFASSGVLAGTTATCVLQTGCLVTVANVGDSLGLLDTGYDVLAITADHRVCDSAEEQDRVTQLGGTITNVDRSGHGPSADPVNGLGPLRIWPGGVANARAIGDFDVPGYLLPCPHIHQLVVPRQGGRMVIASDGVWDAFDMKRVAKLTRSHPTAVAAGKILTTVVRAQGGLRDDTSLIVVDILPPGVDSFPEAIGRKKPSSGGTSSGQKELAAARTAVQSSSWCCMSRPAVIEADASVYNASVHSDPSVHPDISLRSRPLARMLADVDVAAVLGLMPGVRRPFSGLWRDAVLLAALVETQKDALEVFNNSFGQRRQGLKPSPSLGGSQSLLDYFQRAQEAEAEQGGPAGPAGKAAAKATAKAQAHAALRHAYTARVMDARVPAATLLQQQQASKPGAGDPSSSSTLASPTGASAAGDSMGGQDLAPDAASGPARHGQLQGSFPMTALQQYSERVSFEAVSSSRGGQGAEVESGSPARRGQLPGSFPSIALQQYSESVSLEAVTSSNLPPPTPFSPGFGVDPAQAHSQYVPQLEASGPGSLQTSDAAVGLGLQRDCNRTDIDSARLLQPKRFMLHSQSPSAAGRGAAGSTDGSVQRQITVRRASPPATPAQAQSLQPAKGSPIGPQQNMQVLPVVGDSAHGASKAQEDASPSNAIGIARSAHSTHSVASLPYVDDSAHGANEMGKLDLCSMALQQAGASAI